MRLDKRILGIQGWMPTVVLHWMVDTASKLPEGSVIVEVGCWKGLSTAAWCQGLGNRGTVFAVDSWTGEIESKFQQAELKNVDVFRAFQDNLHELGLYPAAIRMPSADAVKLFADDRILDIVFLDANKKNIREDLDNWVPKIKRGGIICGRTTGKLTPEGKQLLLDRFLDIKWIDSGTWWSRVSE